MKKLKLCALMLGASMAAYAQNTTEYAFEDLRLSQTELRGTSRFM